MSKVVKIIIALSLFFNFAVASEEDILNATNTFQVMLRSSNNKIPKELLSSAKAIAIVPNSFRAAFIVSGGGGSGIMSVKNENGWSYPVFVNIGGGNIGLQIGFEKSDKLIMFMSEESVEKVLAGGLNFGADATAAAGPVGASKSNVFTADIYTYAQEKGLFAGVSIGGLVMAADDETTKATYGEKFDATSVARGKVAVPYSYATDKFIKVMNKEFK